MRRAELHYAFQQRHGPIQPMVALFNVRGREQGRDHIFVETQSVAKLERGLCELAFLRKLNTALVMILGTLLGGAASPETKQKNADDGESEPMRQRVSVTTKHRSASQADAGFHIFGAAAQVSQFR